MVTHHLCDTRLAVPGVLSPGSCSNPGNNHPWPCRELLGLPSPSAYAVSPPGPVDAPRCPSGFRALLGTGWGEELHRDPPPDPAWGCSSSVLWVRVPKPNSCMSQPSCPEDTAHFSPEHTRSSLSAPSDLLHPLSTRTSRSQSQSCYSCSQSSQSQPKIRPGLRADTCLGLCFVLGRQDGDLGRRWGYPWGNSFDVSEEGWNLKADLGFPFSFGIFGAMNTRRH